MLRVFCAVLSEIEWIVDCLCILASLPCFELYPFLPRVVSLHVILPSG
jgi:hypothetical protein